MTSKFVTISFLCVVVVACNLEQSDPILTEVGSAQQAMEFEDEPQPICQDTIDASFFRATGCVPIDAASQVCTCHYIMFETCRELSSYGVDLENGGSTITCEVEVNRLPDLITTCVIFNESEAPLPLLPTEGYSCTP